MKILLIIALFLTGCSINRVIPRHFKGEITYNCDFQDSTDLNRFILGNDAYNQNKVWFKPEMVRVVKDTGLVIDCLYSPDTSGRFNFISGSLQTWNHDTTLFIQSGGVWVFYAAFPESWAAIWMLSPNYRVPGFDRDFIVPEIDVAENNGDGIDNCVHYGYSVEKYNAHSHVRRMHRYDGLMHEYAVEIKPNGYDFYRDGILRNRFRSKDPEFVSGQPYYMIINNASDSRFPVKNTKFIVKKIIVLK